MKLLTALKRHHRALIFRYFAGPSFRIIAARFNGNIEEIKMRLHTILAGLAAILLAGTASAAGLSIEPGKWEMTSTMTMTMMPQPHVTTNVECMEEDELSPEDFNMDEENPCEITEVTIEDNSARWLISCPTEGGQTMDGHWEVSSTGDSLTGKGAMTMEYSGQKMGFEMSWQGKRIGDCE
jgi:hypothetical protein